MSQDALVALLALRVVGVEPKGEHLTRSRHEPDRSPDPQESIGACRFVEVNHRQHRRLQPFGQRCERGRARLTCWSR